MEVIHFDNTRFGVEVSRIKKTTKLEPRKICFKD